MIATADKLSQLLKQGSEFISTSSELELSKKESASKWSKKEILGHLIDSAINNLQRFTEIQYEEKPYLIRGYNQDELVKANDYQNTETKTILQFWLAINHQIMSIINNQTEETLSYKIEFNTGETYDLRFLMTDYVDHIEHHMKQILGSS